jgi:hypothetical protein
MKTLQSIINKPTRQLNLSPSKSLQMNYKQIHFTYDYDQFKFIKGNRNVKQSHVKSLIESMKIEYLKIPIDVNEKMEIIDGQHRYMAIKELQLPLFYIVRHGWGIKEMQMCNMNKIKWSGTDEMDSQCELNNINYIRIKRLMEKYNINIVTARLCMNHKKSVASFMHGQWIATSEDYDRACVIAEFLNAVKSKYGIDTSRYALVAAISKLYDNPNFNLKHFEKKLNIVHNRFYPVLTVDEQIEQIETLYNYRNQNKVNLRINTLTSKKK